MVVVMVVAMVVVKLSVHGAVIVVVVVTCYEGQNPGHQLDDLRVFDKDSNNGENQGTDKNQEPNYRESLRSCKPTWKQILHFSIYKVMKNRKNID